MSSFESRPPPYFQWIIPEKIAAFAFPSKPYHIRNLLENGIRRLISLQSFPKPPIDSFPEMKWTSIPVEEFSAPSLQQIVDFVEVVEDSLKKQEAVGVHCTFGRGRTGTMLAAFFVFKDQISAGEAIDKIRQIRPYSIETQEQEFAVFSYEQYLKNQKK